MMWMWMASMSLVAIMTIVLLEVILIVGVLINVRT